MIVEIEKEVRSRGYYMMLYAASTEREIRDLIHTWNVDGLLTIGIPTEICRELGKDMKMPAVLPTAISGRMKSSEMLEPRMKRELIRQPLI